MFGAAQSRRVLASNLQRLSSDLPPSERHSTRVTVQRTQHSPVGALIRGNGIFLASGDRESTVAAP
jgi:hypothetical protein